MRAQQTIYGLFRRGFCEMIAPNKGAARTMQVMFGNGRSIRLLTDAEVADPWVQDQIASMKNAGAWPA